MKAAIVLALLLLAAPAQAKSEADWTAEWCGLHGLAYEGPGLRLQTHTGRSVFADCISEHAVVEVDRAHKYKEGIGQAMTYGVLSGRRHVILLLIIEKQRDCDYYTDTDRILRKGFLRIQLAQTGNVSCPEAP